MFVIRLVCYRKDASSSKIFRNFIYCPHRTEERGISHYSLSMLPSGVGILELGIACYFNVHWFICALLIILVGMLNVFFPSKAF